MFLILELIVMEGVCVHLTLGGAENDRSLFCGNRGGDGAAGLLRPSWASASACGGLICGPAGA